MDSISFNKIVKSWVEQITLVLDRKSTQYKDTETDDILHVFKRSATNQRKTPIEALEGMLDKHIVSIQDIFYAARKGEFLDPLVIKEKFGDAINYLILADALLQEERQLATKRSYEEDVLKKHYEAKKKIQDARRASFEADLEKIKSHYFDVPAGEYPENVVTDPLSETQYVAGTDPYADDEVTEVVFEEIEKQPEDDPEIKVEPPAEEQDTNNNTPTVGDPLFNEGDELGW